MGGTASRQDVNNHRWHAESANKALEVLGSDGARIPADLRKTILFVLPTNAAESLVLLAAVLSGTMLPVTPVQILWVNMINAVTLRVSLAWEKAEVGLMQRGPHSIGNC